MSVALELKDKTQQAQLDKAVQELQRTYDQPFELEQHADGTMQLHGCTELDLEIIFDQIIKDHGIKLLAYAPQVAYRETITRRAAISYRHKQGSASAFAELNLSFEPLASGAGALFKDTTALGTLPPIYVTAIAEGLAAAKESGYFAGFPCVDFMATLMGAAYSADASAELFTVAGRAAFRQGMNQAQPVLLEPILKVEVLTPEHFLGDVIGDLNSRRGQVNGMEQRGDIRAVQAVVPLATMFGYINKLRWMTQGSADCRMEYSHYDRVPASGTPSPDDNFPAAAALRQTPYTVTTLDGKSGNGC